MDTVRPAHLQFIEPTKRYADIVIPEGGYNKVAIDMVAKSIPYYTNNYNLPKWQHYKGGFMKNKKVKTRYWPLIY